MTKIGTIGRCQVCGKAIQFRRGSLFHWGPPPFITTQSKPRWGHFINSDHAAVLSPGVI